ncbi:hypothetical protein [Phreatobacter stygius]|uniref:Core-binding (CB) domain-containing protein n=1 Tax=Phreatobacter stygius TaxID=1940610 RepID=A0A4D7BIK1_9HYPH|nr:hypothetical protein [Phreatobacter stygius]QCI68856.1 hypothetical protein E8M01_34270 [Phreatobacter stygius]
MPKKTLLNLGKYVRPVRKKGRLVGYYFSLPGWVYKIAPDDPRGPCPVRGQALGLDPDIARTKGSELRERFDTWRLYDGEPQTQANTAPRRGSFDWLAAEYKADKRFKGLGAKTRKNHGNNLALVSRYLLKNGQRFGDQLISVITPKAVDALFDALIKKGDGERRTSINNAMRTCRRAWNVAHRCEPSVVPKANPFAKMGLKDVYDETTPATYEQLLAFMATADANDRASLSAAALNAWEWQQREVDIFGRFLVTHYRPPARPDMVRIVHYKNKERKEVWQPLFDPATGTPLFPELQARLDKLTAGRDVGHALLRDWPDATAGRPLPWPAPKGGLDFMIKEVRRICKLADLPEEITFASFRHGGYTEGGDAELTDSEFRATSGKDATTLPLYVHRTVKQIATAQRKRRAVREQN